MAVHTPGSADLNLYAYVKGEVIKSTDLLGLDKKADDAMQASLRSLDAGERTDGKWNVEGPQADVPAPPGVHFYKLPPLEVTVHVYGEARRGDSAGLEVLGLLGTQAGGFAKGMYRTAEGTKVLACPMCAASDLGATMYDVATHPKEALAQIKEFVRELRTNPHAVADLSGH